jgi:hypothetical protein
MVTIERARQELRAERAYRGALWSVAINVVGWPLELAYSTRVPSMPRWPSIAQGAVGACLAVILYLMRRRRSVPFAAATFALNNLAIFGALWVMNEHAASALAGAWAPFQANKLGALAAAMLAPELWSGLFTVLGFFGTALAQYASYAPPLRAPMSAEPWATLAYGLFGVALLAYHLRSRDFELDTLRARLETEAATNLANKLMAIRDLTNTPLQTLELTAMVVRHRRRLDLAQQLRIERSLARLRELNHVIDSMAEAAHATGAWESFDPRTFFADHR